MKKIFKNLLIVLLLSVSFFGAKYYYDIHINNNFEIISERKVYKSGVIPPNKIQNYIKKYNIKSVIDLRFPGTADLVNNPEVPAELIAEKETIAKIKGINYFNNGSEQVPQQHNLDSFYKIMDNHENYPVLIHCYHGVGRAELYSAIYRIEYENWKNTDARLATRTFVKFSSFDIGKPKGDFLENYKKRVKN